jgi:beta-lactam-binding protein with PASTA domain
VAQPPPPPTDPEDATYVETREAGPYPPGRRVVVDEGPPVRDIWPWLLAALFAALAIIFLVLWLTHRHSGPATRRVPSVVGLRQTEAQRAAFARSFRVKSTFRATANPPGTVVDQAPNAGAALQKGALMFIVVSGGQKKALVPRLTGLKLAAAKRLVDSVHLSARVQTVTSDKPAGIVVSQSPAAGQTIAQGADVTLSVSNGSNIVAVPALRGLSVEKATAALANVGLTGQVIQVAAPEAAGTVIAQDPPRGQKVKRGSAVRINVSRGPSVTTTQGQTTTVVATSVATTVVTTTAPAP